MKRKILLICTVMLIGILTGCGQKDPAKIVDKAIENLKTYPSIEMTVKLDDA